MEFFFLSCWPFYFFLPQYHIKREDPKEKQWYDRACLVTDRNPRFRWFWSPGGTPCWYWDRRLLTRHSFSISSRKIGLVVHVDVITKCAHVFNLSCSPVDLSYNKKSPLGPKHEKIPYLIYYNIFTLAIICPIFIYSLVSLSWINLYLLSS